MNALFVFKNNVRQLAASLSPTALVSFDPDWIANVEKELFVDVTKVDDVGTHRWSPISLRNGKGDIH